MRECCSAALWIHHCSGNQGKSEKRQCFSGWENFKEFFQCTRFQLAMRDAQQTHSDALPLKFCTQDASLK